LGARRPNQYRMDPGEGTHTDKRTADADQADLKNEDAASSRAHAGGRQMIPPSVPNPEVERVRAEELKRQEHLHADDPAEE